MVEGRSHVVVLEREQIEPIGLLGAGECGRRPLGEIQESASHVGWRPCPPSPLCARRSSAYSRIVSSMRTRGTVAVSSTARAGFAWRATRPGRRGLPAKARCRRRRPPRWRRAPRHRAKTPSRASRVCSAAFEEVVAPVNGGPQRLLSRGKITGAAGEEGQAESPAGAKSCVGRQEPRACGGQLDRQRQPIQAPADGRHRLDVLGGDDEVRRTSWRDGKEADRVIVRQGRRPQRLAPVIAERHRQGRYGKITLTRDPQRRPAGHQNGEPRARALTSAAMAVAAPGPARDCRARGGCRAPAGSAISASSVDWSTDSRTPRTLAIVCGTRSRSLSVAIGTNHTPSASAFDQPRAMARARRVLPMPPGPEVSTWDSRITNRPEAALDLMRTARRTRLVAAADCRRCCARP